MLRKAQDETINSLPVAELKTSAEAFLGPLLRELPNKRLRSVGVLMVLGILAGQSPLITQMARGVREGSRYVLDMARYRIIWNKRLSYEGLQVGLYRLGQQMVARYEPSALVVALDPVNCEKPYTHELEGVSTVYKSRPPDRQGKGRLARGYPALTACIVNLPEPMLTYTHWFSYTRAFLSEAAELQAAVRTTRTLYPEHKLCLVGDSGLDDQKLFDYIRTTNSAFIIRVGHAERCVDVYNERLKRLGRETVQT